MIHVNDIAAWRERIFASLLPVVLVVGTLATISIIPILLAHGMWPVLLIDSLALAWIFVVWRLKHLPYKLRVVNFLAVVYALSIGLMLTVGAASLSYLLGPPVIAAILLSTRPAMFALALGAASIVGLGATDHITLNVPGWEHESLKASLVAASNYISVGAMLTLTCGTLLKGLSRTLAEVRGVAASLEINQAALHDLNDELALTSAAVARLNDMVLIARAVDGWDADQPITFVNDAFLHRTGYTRGEVVGQSLRMLQGEDMDKALVARITAAIAAREPCNAELMARARDGTPFWVEVEMVPFARADERASHWVIVGRDITERRAAADAIHRLAFYDVLTGLPNRRLLMDKLDLLVAQAADGSGIGALLYLDLDNFKDVNDARGHAAGDALLVHAAARLSDAVRAGDTVARIGGDEFVVLLDGVDADAASARRRALAVADKIRAALGAALDIGGHTLHIAASIGIAMPLRAGITAHDLLREADTAMYHAKAGGRDGVAVFEDAMLADAQHKLTLEHALAQALDNGELAMHLQLQVDHDGVATGAELLMRWQRPGAGFVAPDVFIPIAEASGLIVPLGHWVLRQACQAWLRLADAGHPLPLSINVSPVQFRQPDFVARVRATLLENGVPAQAMIFEITEGLLVNELDQTVARMHELAAMGIRFSIDDFGTGYSNLAYLKRMPLYELKIDKSFVRDMPHDVNGTAIVQSILAMAGHMGLRVVAEGIETAEQAAFLAENGRACMQGYLFCRPMPLDALLVRLTALDAAAHPARFAALSFETATI
jgi:diguanylate cyclase (GGDEF)-like protein/PAS domain S-box-containing protein